MQSEGLSRVFSNITVHKHPFERENKMAEEQVDVEDVSLGGYIRNTPSDTELQAAAAESRQESLTREKKIRYHAKLGWMKELGGKKSSISRTTSALSRWGN